MTKAPAKTATKTTPKKESNLKDVLLTARSDTSDAKLRELLGEVINYLDQAK